MWRRVVSGFSEAYTASIFREEEKCKPATNKKVVVCFFGSVYDLEDWASFSDTVPSDVYKWPINPTYPIHTPSIVTPIIRDSIMLVDTEQNAYK
jgi:extradiol dioxygenase family protein